MRCGWAKVLSNRLNVAHCQNHSELLLPGPCSAEGLQILVWFQKGQIELPEEPVILLASQSCASSPGCAEERAGLNLSVEVKPMEHP